MKYHQSTEPRAAALEILEAIKRRHRPLDEVLATHEGLAEMESRDRAFTRLLVTLMLRRFGQLDEAVNAVLTRPEDLPEGAIREIMRLGVAQLLYLETAPHAAVDGCVRLATKIAKGRYAGLVNACLRRMTREEFTGGTADEKAGSINTPAWLWESWVADWGLEVAEKISVAHLSPADLDISLACAADDSDEILRWAEKLEAEILPTGSLRRKVGGMVTELDGFEEGAWWVQDMAAALPVKICGDVKGKKVIDLCAAPGGKTMQFALAGADVVAVDRSKPRLQRLEENLARVNLSAEVIVADATTWQPDALADIVLIDAPCSSTGTIRRHPDILWLKRESDILKLSNLQKRILDNAKSMIKPDGVLIFCTCSLQKSEGEARTEEFLQENQEFSRDVILAKEVGGLTEILNILGDIRTSPADLAALGGIDGFYCARLRRKA